MLEVNWNLVWTIACGIVLGGFLLSILSLLGRMWASNPKVTVLVVLCHIIFPAIFVGAFMGYFAWIWLIPAFIAGGACYFIATDILVREEEGDQEIY